MITVIKRLHGYSLSLTHTHTHTLTLQRVYKLINQSWPSVNKTSLFSSLSYFHSVAFFIIYLGLSGTHSAQCLIFWPFTFTSARNSDGTNPCASTILFRPVIPAITFWQPPFLYSRLTAGRGSRSPPASIDMLRVELSGGGGYGTAHHVTSLRYIMPDKIAFESKCIFIIRSQISFKKHRALEMNLFFGLN